MAFSQHWPGWPAQGASTIVLLDAQACVDDLFKLIFGPESGFQVRKS
jgi:hypothetical protein